MAGVCTIKLNVERFDKKIGFSPPSEQIFSSSGQVCPRPNLSREPPISLSERFAGSARRTSSLIFRGPRGRCSRKVCVSISLVGVVGICGVASRVGGVAERVHIPIASSMAVASLAVHVVFREPVVGEKAGGRVRDVRRNRKSTLGRRGILMGWKRVRHLKGGSGSGY